MPMIVRAFPLVTPRTELEGFAAALRKRHAEATACYRKYGVSHESWFLQEMDGKPWVIVCSDIEDPGPAGAKYAAATDPFDAWFKSEVMRLSGVDPSRTPLGLPSEQIFRWDDPT